MRLSAAPSILALLVLGCRSSGAVGWAGAGTALAAPGPLPAEVRDAERLLRDLRPEEALRGLEAAGGVDASAPERSWLLLDLYASRCEAERARRAADALPPGDMADVLRAHARRDPRERLPLVARAARGDAAPWALLETAFATAEEGGERSTVLSLARRAAETGPAFVRREALLAIARSSLEADAALPALSAAEEASLEDPLDPRGPATASRAAMRLGRLEEAVLLAANALRLQPRSPRAARRVADLLREEPGTGAEERVRRDLSALLARSDLTGEASALAGLLSERAGDREVAIARYEAALAHGADPVPVDRHLRRLLWAAGRRREAAALLLGAVPKDEVAREDNLVRGAFARLEFAAGSAPDGPGASPESLLALARALAGVGAVADAAIVAGSVATDEARALARQWEGHVAFERAVRDAVEEGYRAPAAKRAPPTMDALLTRMREAALAHLSPEEAAPLQAPDPGAKSFPLLGSWLDFSAATRSPLVAHFRRYGRFLVVGQRKGKPAEVVLMSLASLVPGRAISTQGRVLSHDVAVGYDREIRSYLDHQGGSLSGATLPDAVWLDADAARREDHGLRAALAVDPALVERAARAGTSPPAADGEDGVFAMDDPAGLSLRLAARSVSRAGMDPWASFDVLRAHEFGHVLDLARYLPLSRRWPSALSLLAGQGFDAGGVEALLEARAQTAAVMDAADTDRALLDLVRVLPLFERAPEAHERGYRDVVLRMVHWVERHAAELPAVDASRTILPQLDRLTPAEVRRMARDLAGAPSPR